MKRRKFLKILLAAVCSPWVAVPADANASPSPGVVTLFHTHTLETATIPCPRSGGLPRADQKRLAHILRDHRTGAVRAIDPALFDLLTAIQGRLSRPQPFHVISGYRSPATNQMLIRTGGGVARSSLHTLGRAVDIRMPGLPTESLHRICVSLKRGGVGHYPDSDFVHVDTGRIRYW